MHTAERTQPLHFVSHDPIEPRELEHIAFMEQSEITHGIFRSIAVDRRSAFTNKYILSEVIRGGIKKLRNFLAVSAEAAANDEKAFIDETIKLFVQTSRTHGSFTRELFESMLLWADELTKLSLLREALHLYDDALAMEINKFPDLNVRCMLGKGGVLNLTGNFSETESLISSLAQKPYLITDRNLLPQLYFNLGQESLLRGKVGFYKRLLFRALRQFYTRMETRKTIVDQIRVTYRYSYKVLLDRQVSLADKLLFTLHCMLFLFQANWLARGLGLATVLRYAVLGYIYVLHYGLRATTILPREAPDEATPPRPSSQQAGILITRAMGGIGDFLMMTPGLHALKKKHPHQDIHLAIPKRYHALFLANTDVRLIDIDENGLDPMSYKKWRNFTDCPAARVEARSAPKVKRSRIELFARGMGIGYVGMKRMKKRPLYALTPEDNAFRQAFWRDHQLDGKTVIGVQLHSDEIYRDYPHMRELVRQLARTYHVMVFDAETIRGFEGEMITKVEGFPLRRAFALVAGCNAIVAPDSAFVHLAAALDIPCVALYGPVDGEVRTRHYPKCVYLDVRKKLGCLPCWRNEKIPCKLTNMRTSVCLADIAVDEISNQLQVLLDKEQRV